MNILLTDCLFPVKYSKWRLVEIKSFIHEFRCDILCIRKCNSYAGCSFEFDFNILKDDFKLDEYDILIFNPNFNYVNCYNIDFDGTSFNGKINADYMFRHKSRRSDSVSFQIYDVTYHIFLYCYMNFNSVISFPQEKQVIHLYPGGSYVNSNSIYNINKDVKIISAQKFITDSIKYNRYIEVFGVPLFYKNEEITEKVYNTNLCVCFTSMGSIYEKGAYIYDSAVTLYKSQYPGDAVNFIAIGNAIKNHHVKQYELMSQSELSNFYKKNVDILISLDTGVALNGFPLGAEAMIEGCVVLMTDIHNQNIANNFNFDPFFIVNKDDIPGIIEKIKQLSVTSFLQEKGKLIQQKTHDLFNYDNTMQKIFKYITH